MTASIPLSDTAIPVAERWRRTPRRWRVVLAALALLVLAELASSIISGLGGGSAASGHSSTFDSSATGTEAFGQLLSLRGHAVERITTPLAEQPLPRGSTLFVLDPTSWTGADTAVVARALADGRRVVLGGRPPGTGVLRSLLGTDSAPMWRLDSSGTAYPVPGGPAFAGVSRVVVPGTGSYAGGSIDANGRAVLTGPGGVLAVVAGQRGPLVLLASSSCLTNESLGRADDAAFALDLAGPGTTPVFFDEYDHGFGRGGTGLAGLPGRWRWGLAIALLALLLWLLSAARRFGPPAPIERATIPSRVEYVDALSTLLSTRPAGELVDVVAPVYEEAGRLAARIGSPSSNVSTDGSGRFANAGAVDTDLFAALRVAPASSSDIVQAGRAFAQLERGNTR